MTIELDHTIVPASDRRRSARFLAGLLDLPEPESLGPFEIVRIRGTTLDFVDADEIPSHHYAFLVTEEQFDAIFARIEARGLTFWADPYRRDAGRINTWDDGRGVYWDDPDGHLLEIITRPYGTGGSTTTNPHPLGDAAV